MSREESGLNKEFIYTWNSINRKQEGERFRKRLRSAAISMAIFAAGALYVLVSIKLSYVPY